MVEKEQSVFNKVRAHYYKEGLWYILKLLSVKYIFNIRTLTIAKRNLQKPINEIKPQIDVEIRKIDFNDFPSLGSRGFESKLKIFRERLSDNIVGFVVFHKGELASYCWLSLKEVYEPVFQVTIPLEKNEGFILDDYTFPQFRGKRIQSFMVATRLQLLRDIGCREVFVCYHKKNNFSRKALKSNGFKEVKEVSLVNIFGIKFHLWKNI